MYKRQTHSSPVIVQVAFGCSPSVITRLMAAERLPKKGIALVGVKSRWASNGGYTASGGSDMSRSVENDVPDREYTLYLSGPSYSAFSIGKENG